MTQIIHLKLDIFNSLLLQILIQTSHAGLYQKLFQLNMMLKYVRWCMQCLKYACHEHFEIYFINMHAANLTFSNFESYFNYVGYNGDRSDSCATLREALLR